MENEMKKPPVKIFRCGAIQAAIWLHPTGIGGAIVDIPSVRISKSYRDKGTGDWLNTDFLRADDLPKVSLVATEAFKYLRLKSPHLEGQSESSYLSEGAE